MKKGDLGYVDLGGISIDATREWQRGGLYRSERGGEKDLIGRVEQGAPVMFLECYWIQTFPPTLQVISGDQVGWFRGWVLELKENNDETR